MKRLNIFKSFLIAVLIFLLCHSAHGFDLKSKVIKTKLQNGITVLMLERHTSPTVSLYIRYRVGAVDEEKGKSGAAHFLEHMMFKGTASIGIRDYRAEEKILREIEKTGQRLDREKRKGRRANTALVKKLSFRLKSLQGDHKNYFIPNEIDRLYTENGGLDMNASTGQDVTTYHVSLPANKLELWARIESDRLLNPVFRDFYTERDVVMEERRQRVESNPEGKLYEQFMNAAYKTHPYGRPILGWTDDLIYLSPDDLKKILKRYRTPESIVIAVVGDIQPDETLALVEKYFGKLPSVKKMKDDLPDELPQKAERRVNLQFDASPMIMIGYHKPNAPDDHDYVFDVLETILSKGRTSRLYDTLVTRLQIAKSVSAINGIPASRYPNLFTIFAQPRHPHTNAELEEKIMLEIDKIKSEPVPPEELIKAKNNIKMSYIQSLNSNSELASILSYYEVLLGDYQYFSAYLDRIEQVTADDIQTVAMTYLNQNNRTIAVLNKNAE
jgi:predicted Zn-dependent peptidase